LSTQVERRFRCDAEALAEARRLVVGALDDAGIASDATGSDVRDSVLLVAGEMLANAVRACHFILVLKVSIHSDRVDLAVLDDSPQPAVQRQPDPDSTDGRGLRIIDVLSESWGQTPWNGTTKTVWSSIRLPAGAR
jgi:hypothetical protein